MDKVSTKRSVSEDPSRVSMMPHEPISRSIDFVCNELQNDSVVLLREVRPEDADLIIFHVAKRLNIFD
ncbi:MULTISPECIES: hypothetical protein [Burkholderiaceae]|uniref:hypothetical protein n=1 Tax=Burkholderiaceae TaxID=119060 RepID=UPI00095EDECB|nr:MULTISPECIES: hypothetical protein [Burkholderiaceae]MCG1018515.1 hypothetical protein [Mycetohabitans sp. B4]SIT79404.1 hypothetical protein SAMN04487768_0236 [Burkholderia sp. b13]